MIYKALIMTCMIAGAISMYAKADESSSMQEAKETRLTSKTEGQRVYKLIVNEADSGSVQEYNRGLKETRALRNRGFFSDVVGLYRSTFVGQATTATTSLIELGYSAIKNATSDKQPQWQAAVENECKFVRQLPMQHEILDFYSKPSTNGPLDPSDMLFNGFGCRQVIETNINNKKVEEDVFYLSCKLRTDTVGLSRMLNHSKFEVYIDELRFKPALCDLPNDSLGLNTDTRIGLSFEKRKNLKFKVKATITSSWINQAMQVYNDQYLGEFNIEADIDPAQLVDGVFTYNSSEPADTIKRVKIYGDCFLIPRSYVGTTVINANNETQMQDSWGTGQYKVELQLSETCDINEEYYQENHKWIKERWNEEWQLIKQRKPSQSVFSKVLNIVGVGYTNNQWITTLTEPIKTIIVQDATQWINSASSTMPTAISNVQ